MPDDRKPCAGCGVEVWWVRHERTGNPAPLVLAPESVKPNVMVFDREGEKVYRIRKKDELPNFYAYINHFSDCPKAANFKRSKNGSTRG